MSEFWQSIYDHSIGAIVGAVIGALGTGLIAVWRLTRQGAAIVALRIVAENLDKKITQEITDRVEGDARTMQVIEREFADARREADNRHVENSRRLGTIEEDVKQLLSRNPVAPWRPMT